MYVQNVIRSVMVTEWLHLEKDLPYVYFVLCIFEVIVFPHYFGFDDKIRF